MYLKRQRHPVKASIIPHLHELTTPADRMVVQVVVGIVLQLLEAGSNAIKDRLGRIAVRNLLNDSGLNNDRV